MAALPPLHTYRYTLFFPERYIAQPYWTELLQLIDIQKQSGMNRARSEQKRTQALAEYLRRNGISEEAYQALQEVAARPFYRQDSATWSGPIVIPSHQLYGCLIETADHLNRSQRPCDPDNLRHVLRLSDAVTTRQEADGIYTRPVMPKSGTGQPLSNQRSLRSDPYIENFSATGTVAFYADTIHNADELQDFFAYAGQRIGVGAARKMACGRFLVIAWEAVPSSAAPPAPA